MAFEKWKKRRAYFVGFTRPAKYLQEVKKVAQFYDSRKKEFVDEEPPWWKEIREEREKIRALIGKATGSSRLPVLTPLYEAKTDEGDTDKEVACDAVIDIGERLIEPRPHAEKGTYGTSYAYRDFWSGINRVKFPNTWNWCVKFYYSGNYHQETKSSYTSGNYYTKDAAAPYSAPAWVKHNHGGVNQYGPSPKPDDEKTTKEIIPYNTDYGDC